MKRVAAPLCVRCAARCAVDVEENGATFADNAGQKAAAASRVAPRALALASDGGLEIPALGDAWDPLRTNRFAPGDATASKAQQLLALMAPLRGAERAAQWVEALAVARAGRVLATWTERGPRCRVASAAPHDVGPLWVDGLLERCEGGPTHWDKLALRFSEFCAG